MKNRILMALFLLAAMLLLAGCRTETIVYGDNLETAETAVIFYPGGRVDPGAYGQLLQMVSEQGIPVIVARMPLNLAILHGSAASNIMKEHPEVFDPRTYLKPARANIKELVKDRIVNVLGCDGKA